MDELSRDPKSVLPHPSPRSQEPLAPLVALSCSHRNPTAPRIRDAFSLGAIVCKYDLRWAIWSPLGKAWQSFQGAGIAPTSCAWNPTFCAACSACASSASVRRHAVLLFLLRCCRCRLGSKSAVADLWFRRCRHKTACVSSRAALRLEPPADLAPPQTKLPMISTGLAGRFLVVSLGLAVEYQNHLCRFLLFEPPIQSLWERNKHK